MSMTIPEAHAEIRKHYEAAAALEAKYPDGLTQDDNAEDYAEVKRLLGEIDGLEAKLSGLEDAAARKARILENQKHLSRPAQRHQQPDTGGEPDRAVEMFGKQFILADEYKRVVESGVLKNPSSRVEFGVQLKGSLLDYLARKALVSSGSGAGGPLIIPEYRPGFIDILQRQTTILDLIPVAQTTSNLIDYIKELTFTNNAAFVSEATATTGTTGTKPESGMTFQLLNTAVQTLAHWMPVTNQMLSDAPAIRGVIDARLLLGLQLVLETNVINGNGTPPNLSGILGAGISALGLGTDSTADAIYKAMTTVMVTGLANPSGVVLHPNDWQTIRLSRESTGSTGLLGTYLMGPPSMVGAQTLWGRIVVLALGMPENTGLVGDFALGCMLFDREESAIRTGTINDQFVRNMQTILAELRAAFVVFRPTAFCQVTGI
jgi:HK97 family phage major capsid protein